MSSILSLITKLVKIAPMIEKAVKAAISLYQALRKAYIERNQKKAFEKAEKEKNVKDLRKEISKRL